MNIMFKDIVVAEFDHEHFIDAKVYKRDMLKYTYLRYLRAVGCSVDYSAKLRNYETLRKWLYSRVMSGSRVYSGEVISSADVCLVNGSDKVMQLAIFTRALSMNDCFWLKYSDEDNVTWKDVCLRNNTHDIKSAGASLLGKLVRDVDKKHFYADLSTAGLSPKAWIKEGDDWYLLKGKCVDGNSLLCEQAASTILDSFNVNHVKYTLTEFEGVPCTKCKCISSDKYSIISASVLFGAAKDSWYKTYKSILTEYTSDYAKMCVVDYLLMNNNRGTDSWGFLMDNDTMEIVSMHPLINFNSAFMSEFGCDEFNEHHFYSTISKFIEKADLEMISPLSLEVFNFNPQLITPFLERLSKIGIKYEVRDNVVYPK